MDLNGDGNLDILSGRYSPPVVTFFEGTPTGFKKGTIISEKGLEPGATVPIDQYHGSACLADLNGDGLFDIVVGTNTGAVFVNLNVGTAQQPKFGQRVPLLLADGKPVKVVSRAKPTVADWDGDGVPDLLVGDEMCGVTFFRGIKAPRGQTLTFAPGVPVIPGKPKGIVPGFRARPAVADFYHRGKLDLLVGNCETGPDGKLTGYVYLFLRK